MVLKCESGPSCAPGTAFRVSQPFRYLKSSCEYSASIRAATASLAIYRWRSSGKITRSKSGARIRGARSESSPICRHASVHRVRTKAGAASIRATKFISASRSGPLTPTFSASRYLSHTVSMSSISSTCQPNHQFYRLLRSLPRAEITVHRVKSPLSDRSRPPPAAGAHSPPLPFHAPGVFCGEQVRERRGEVRRACCDSIR
jgi:hypothetical protein